MRICLLCATQRGYRVLEAVHALVPNADYLVFSFREEPWEPPFLDRIRSFAESIGAEFHETKNVAHERWRSLWSSTPIDIALCASWRYMIPPSVYTRPRLGTYVFHDGLLPQYRGFSPTVWAMLNGETQTGVTLFEIAEEVDSGDIVDQEAVPIGTHDTIADVVEAVTETCIKVINRSFTQLLEGNAPRHVQEHCQATFTCKLMPDDVRIDWAMPTATIYNLIRGYTKPYPGACTQLEGKKLHILEARPIEDPKPYVGRVPGRPVEIRGDEGVVVLTGDGEMLIATVQWDGGEPVGAATAIKRLSATLGA